MQNKALVNKIAEQRSEILANCLQMIESGAVTVDDCVRRHPEFTELRELLDAAAAVQNMPLVAMPVHSKRVLRNQMMAHYKSRPKPRQTVIAWPLLRGLLAVGVVVIILFTSGVGLTYAAKDTLPGDTLYPLKRAVEQIQLSTLDGGERSTLLVNIANTRLREIDALLLLDREVPASLINDTANSIYVAVDATSSKDVQQALTVKAEIVLEHAQAVGAVSGNDATHVFTVLGNGKSSEDHGNSKQASNTPESTFTLTASATITFTSAPTGTKEPTSTPTLTLTPSETPTATISETATVTPSKTRPAFRPTKASGNGNGNNGNGNGNANGSSNGNANGNANGSSGNGNSNGNANGNANGNGK